MARIRTIKPEFFNSFDVASLSPLSRLFYAFLWTEADREGLMEWKPKNYRMRFFPTDDYQVDDLANELIDAGLIVIHDDEICQIPEFKKHQVINNRESDSVLLSRVVTRGSGRKEGRKGKEGKGTDASEDPPLNEIVDLYHAILPELPRVVALNDKRKSQLRARWNQTANTKSLDWWRGYFELVRTQPFLMGQTGKDFLANLDFLTTESKFLKVIEGSYAGRQA